MPAHSNRRSRLRQPGSLRWRGAVTASPIVGAIAIAGASPAVAQTLFDRSDNVPVLTRPHPEYAPLGIRDGAWLFFPKIIIDPTYDDNIFAAPTDTESDVNIVVRPSLNVNSDWNQNSLSLEADATFNKYITHTEEDTTQYHIELQNEFNVKHDFTLSDQAYYEDEIIPRTSAAYTKVSLNPLEFQEASANLSGVEVSDRLKLTVGGQVYHDVYLDGTSADGTVLDEDFRNNARYVGELRTDYAVSPDLAVFVEEQLSRAQYDNASDRNSWGTQTLVGVNFQVTHLVTGEIGAGYLTENYTNPQDRDTGSPHGRLQLQWFPTQLVTVTFTASQSLYDSGLVDSPAFLSRSLEIQADYELLRHLIVTVKGGEDWNAYKGIDRHDSTPNAGLSITYLLNRAVGVSLTYNRLSLSSVGLNRGFDFDDDRIGLALTLQR